MRELQAWILARIRGEDAAAAADYPPPATVRAAAVPPGVALPLLLLVVGALVLRAWALQRQSISMDEMTEFWNIGHTYRQILFIQDGFPPLYDLLLRSWMAIFHADMAARWMSVVLGCATVVVMWGLGKQIGGDSAAFWSGLLAATSPLLVWYSQEARAYGLYLALAALSLWTLFRALERDSALDWSLYALTAIVGLYTHYYFALLLATNALLVLWERRTWPALRRAVVAHLVIGVLALPLLWLFRIDIGAQTSTTAAGATAPFTPVAAGYTFFSFIAGYGVGPSQSELHTARLREVIPSLLPWVVLTGASVALLAWYGLRALRGSPWPRRLLVLALLPVLISGLIGNALGIGYRVRYAAFCIIPLLLLIAAGCALSRTRWRTVAAVVLLGIFGTSIARRATMERYANEDVRRTASFIQSASSPDAPVFVVADYMAPVVQYYLGKAWHVTPLPTAAARDSVMLAGEIVRDSTPPGGRFWLVYSRAFHGDPNGLLRDTFIDERLMRERQELPGVVIYEGRVP